MTRRWLITGCSTGLGRALAIAVAQSGQRVLATARRPETLLPLREAHPDTVATCALDVRDPDACRAAVQAALDHFGGVDVLVNNAGYGQLGTVEEIGDEELAAQFETNLFGPWRLTRLVLPHMRTQRRGDIVMVSSTSGRVAYPGLSAYTAAKFALEGLVESLATELAGTGVHVTSVQPGAFATEWGASCAERRQHVAAYDEMVDPMRAGMRSLKTLPFASPPALFASEVMRLIAGEDRPLRLPVGEDSWETALMATQRAHADLLALRGDSAIQVRSFS
jgi:NAD(P)-dependent dehydrogenase (short-subunit alcohol dehydrogenase family)